PFVRRNIPGLKQESAVQLQTYAATDVVHDGVEVAYLQGNRDVHRSAEHAVGPGRRVTLRPAEAHATADALGAEPHVQELIHLRGPGGSGRAPPVVLEPGRIIGTS